MMDKKSLRIGNYYLYKGNEIKFDASDFKEIDHNLLALLNPIPLTEDWLIKFGFDKEPISWSIDLNPFMSEFKKLLITLDQGIMIRNGDYDQPRMDDEMIAIYNTDRSGKIMVHQLQNLFYSLTGEELTINEELQKI